MMHYFGFSEGHWFGFIFMIVWWAVIIVALAATIQWIAQNLGNKTHKKTPRDILEERYAKGEIDKKEFEEKMKDLQ